MPNEPHANPALEVISSDEGFVVHDSDRGQVHYLNETAAIVFSLCDGDNDVSDLALRLQEHFDLPSPPEEDVRVLIGQLVEQGILIEPGSEVG